MRITLLFLAAALAALSGCQGAGLNSNESFRAACTQHPYDAGFCEQPTNWHLGTALAGGRQ